MKRYVREPGAVSIRRLLKSDQGAASRLSEVELASALIRRAREGAFTADERDRALASLENDFAALIIVEITQEITAEARSFCSVTGCGPATPFNWRAASTCSAS